MRKFHFFVFFPLFVFLLTTEAAAAGESSPRIDHGIYAQLLSQHVREGVVDYAGFKREEARLDQYLALLEKVETRKLGSQEQFAFYINAYNAWTIKLILSRYPGVESIKDLGSLFTSPRKKKIAKIDGKTLTLDDVEHEILRPRFRDPRVHFAVNCASKGCPPLLSVPYQGEILDEQLSLAAKAFINDPKYNRLEAQRLYVSKIFDWFEEDFDHNVIGFFLKYAEGDLKKNLLAVGKEITIEYLEYDWSLNGN